MLQSWKEQFEENLELCRPELLASMKAKGTLEQYLEDRENQAIEFHAEGMNEGQIVELVVDSLFLREIDEPDE